MSWIDRLRDASFRGVAFKWKTTEDQFGRRQVIHTAALVDTPSAEDMGRAADVFSVEGYLVGEDYDLQRDELIKAVRDTAGPGMLIHPHYGERKVVASDFRIRHDSATGNYCAFTVTFGEDGGETQPTEVTDGPNVLASRADAIKEVSEQSFVERFKSAGFPQFVREAAEGQLSTLGQYLASPSSFLSSTYTDAQGVFGVVKDTVGVGTDLVSEFQQSVADYLGDLGSLVDGPSDLASTITGLIGSIRTTFTTATAGGMLAGLISLFDSDADDSGSGSSTPSRAQVVTNSQAVAAIIKETAAAELAVVAVSQDYETVDEAVAARDVVADIIDEQAEATPSDSVYQQLTMARAEVVQALPSAEQAPSRVVKYSPPATLPALVIAQQLYDDATRAEAIVSRNMVRHPGFVTGGQTLQVLTDA